MKVGRRLKKIKWNIKNWYFKNEHRITPMLDCINHLFMIIMVLISFFYILSMVGVVSIKENFAIEINLIKYKEMYKDLVIAQISSTFLTTAVLSLIASIESKYILGEKETDLLFGKKLQGFYIPMFALYTIMIINIILMINKKSANILIMLFFLSIYILIYVINKI